MTDDAVVAGPWTVVTLRHSTTNKPLLIEGTLEKITTTRKALIAIKKFLKSRETDRPVDTADPFFTGNLAAIRSAQELGSITVEIVQGYSEDEAREAVTKSARRAKCVGVWHGTRPPAPKRLVKPKPKKRAVAKKTPSRSARATTPKAPTAPPAEPCPSCWMMPSTRAISNGECDQCGAELS